MKTERLNRESSFELLRILAMLLIVAHHYSVHGGWDPDAHTAHYWQALLIQLLFIGGKVSCNVFTMISGYFMIRSSLRVKRILLLAAEMSFYSLLCYLLTCGGAITAAGLLHYLSPFSGGSWYCTYYLMFCPIIPFYNQMLSRLDRTTFRNMLLMFLGVWVLFPAVTGIPIYSVFASFPIMYAFGAYFRLYGQPHPGGILRLSGVGILGWCVVILLSRLMHFTRIPGFMESFGEVSSPFSVIVAVFLMAAAGCIHFQSRIVNLLATCTLGVYLIHDNNLLSSVIWSEILPNNLWLHSPLLPLHAVCKILLVFLCCSLLDLFRQLLLEPPMAFLLDRLILFSGTLRKKIQPMFSDVLTSFTR